MKPNESCVAQSCVNTEVLSSPKSTSSPLFPDPYSLAAYSLPLPVYLAKDNVHAAKNQHNIGHIVA
jgi:hypothetical protein